MRFQRVLDLKSLLKKKSFFLFGARATGKSTLVRETLNAKNISLLDSDYYLTLSARPSALRDYLPEDPGEIVVIDEVQRVPELLNEVHHQIEEHGRKFLLTGSSARKLKHGHANLLAGRAWTANLFPLCYPELGKKFNLSALLENGGLPAVVNSEDPKEELKAYARTYLYEEIQAEGLVRKIPQFSRFLRTAALSNGELINYAGLASDAQVPASTIKEHYAILEDTLIGFTLPPWTASRKRKAIQTGKFYFFDTGVTHSLAGTRSLDPNSDLFGKSLEQWIIHEVRAYLSYRRRDDEMSYWRSTAGDEVDLLIGDHTAIEIKATRRVSGKDWKGLQRLGEEQVFKSRLLISRDTQKLNHEKMQGLGVLDFLERLWSDALF